MHDSSIDDHDGKGDMHRIARDYAFTRMEMLADTDLSGYTVEDVKDIENSFHQSQIKLLSNISASQRSSELVYSKNFEDLVRTVKSRLKTLKVDVKQVTTESHTTNMPKLPKINIKPFDGKFEEWIPFKQLFDSLIHNRNLPNVEKLYYLHSLLQGSAYNLVKNFPLCDDSYIDAYNVLCKQYDKKRQVAFMYYERLLNCEVIKNKTSSELERLGRCFTENLSILDKYQLPDKNFMLFHLLWSKLDIATKEAFELLQDGDNSIPQFSTLIEFLGKRARALENCNTKSSNSCKVGIPKPKPVFMVAPVNSCFSCGDSHSIEQCEKFLKLTPNERFNLIKEKKLCILCFSSSHPVRRCRSKVKCDQCPFSHHSLLHFKKEVVAEPARSVCPPPSVLTSQSIESDALFSTAVVLVKNRFGKYQPIRALLDCASACNFISVTCANRLGLKILDGDQSVKGIAQVSTDTCGVVDCYIMPSNKTTSNSFQVKAFVLPNICSDLPHTPNNDHISWDHIKNLMLADPNFFIPGPIEMLLGVNIFAAALRPGLVQGCPGQPVAINTLFGWIIMGDCSIKNNCPLRCNHSTTTSTNSNNNNNNCLFVSQNMTSLDNSIKKFWELENVELPKKLILSKEDMQCEAYFETQHYRNAEGRIVVPLPFADIGNKPKFVDSRSVALRRLYSLEKRFKINPMFGKLYYNFMQDYFDRNHLEEVDPPISNKGQFYYIPHHGILRPDSTTTPLRVVFDASAKDSEGKSLNDTLLPGPKLQNSIFDLLLRFRWHAVVFTGDIKQMYRQILVPLEDADYQRILWRFSLESPVRDFRLLTVTYGVASAPYQALRSIKKLADESSAIAPLGSTVLHRDIYVDDVVTGAPNIEEALKVREELIKILSPAGLHLRKWASNNKEFFHNLNLEDLYSENFHEFTDLDGLTLKILGLSWFPSDDSFVFQYTSFESSCTKRSILSDISRIFDPLGLLSPVVFFAKHLIQRLWHSGVDWDSEIPNTISDDWIRFRTQLSCLSEVPIPRRMIQSYVKLDFHGFCDASEKGYCAVVYCRCVDSKDTITVRLCCAKSKVAPLRRLSLPRLELLSAVLLSELMTAALSALQPLSPPSNVYAWSDSTVALAWIRSCPSRWKTFVANRVASIQDKISPALWRHVAGTDNPADIGSRGLLPEELVRANLWWAGPAWLSQCESEWPDQQVYESRESVIEEQRIYSLVTTKTSTFVEEILSRYSQLERILRILAYCFRYLNNLNKAQPKLLDKCVSSLETNNILKFLVKQVQAQLFSLEIGLLSNQSYNSLPKSFRKLSPFLDTQGLLRVGGRLRHSDIKYDTKHPLLLPRDHRLTRLIIDHYHRKFLHPGVQTLQNLLAQEFWIINSKRSIRSVISSCMKCFRSNPRLANPPFMGDLPAYRINELKPFSSASVDYAGPFDIAMGRGRGARTYKGYICVFVCTTTKAVHLELVSELTSEAYLAALRRFIARRGRCSRLISDQGRNFIGAFNILKELMTDASQKEQIKFVFNPPGSPHFSGLAEAGVKSVKTHLVRVIGAQRLTFEEFYTVLTQVEAVLNSRPLSPLSSDPNDFSVLTPGHFLTQEPLTMLPEEPIEKQVSPLQRWKMLQKMHQDFWRKWHLEYIHTLQQRNKWCTKHENLSVGTLVLIVNEQCSPLQWNLGRIVQLHTGADGICRVVTIRTSSGTYQRPLTKLCPLPIPTN